LVVQGGREKNPDRKKVGLLAQGVINKRDGEEGVSPPKKGPRCRSQMSLSTLEGNFIVPASKDKGAIKDKRPLRNRGKQKTSLGGCRVQGKGRKKKGGGIEEWPSAGKSKRRTGRPSPKSYCKRKQPF